MLTERIHLISFAVRWKMANVIPLYRSAETRISCKFRHLVRAMAVPRRSVTKKWINDFRQVCAVMRRKVKAKARLNEAERHERWTICTASHMKKSKALEVIAGRRARVLSFRQSKRQKSPAGFDLFESPLTSGHRGSQKLAAGNLGS